MSLHISGKKNLMLLQYSLSEICSWVRILGIISRTADLFVTRKEPVAPNGNPLVRFEGWNVGRVFLLGERF